MLDNVIVWWAVNIVVGTVVLLCFAVAVRTIYRGWAFLQVSTTSDSNSDEAAVEHFKALLREAERSMVVHDDGNKMAGSIYENEEIIDAVRQKLTNNEHFRLACHFNCDGNRFTEELRQCPGVEIRIGHGERPEDDVHYKMIDCGRKAHLSRHEFNSKERRYKVIDCGSVPSRLMEQVTDAVLGRYKDHAKNVGTWVI